MNLFKVHDTTFKHQYRWWWKNEVKVSLLKHSLLIFVIQRQVQAAKSAPNVFQLLWCTELLNNFKSKTAGLVRSRRLEINWYYLLRLNKFPVGKQPGWLLLRNLNKPLVQKVAKTTLRLLVSRPPVVGVRILWPSSLPVLFLFPSIFLRTSWYASFLDCKKLCCLASAVALSGLSISGDSFVPSHLYQTFASIPTQSFSLRGYKIFRSVFGLKSVHERLASCSLQVCPTFVVNQYEQLLYCPWRTCRQRNQGG